MSVITPSHRIRFSRMSWALQYNDIDFDSPFGSQSQEIDVPKWAVTADAPPMYEMNAGEWQALLLQLRGKKNQLELWNHARPVPLGTLRGNGAPFTLAADVAQGATSMQLVAGTSNLRSSADNPATTQIDKVTSGSILNPDGTAAALFKPNTTNTIHQITVESLASVVSSLAVGGSISLTQSVHCRATGADDIRPYFVLTHTSNASPYYRLVLFNPATKTFSSLTQGQGFSGTTYGYQDLADGWIRAWVKCIFTKDALTTALTEGYQLWKATTQTYAGSGTEGIYIFGARVETGPDLTDYGYGKTLLKGDLLGIGSGLTQQVVMLTEDALSIGQGNITVYFEAPLRNAFTAGTAVRFDKPKALFRRQGESRAGWDYESTLARGFNLQLIEDWRA